VSQRQMTAGGTIFVSVTLPKLTKTIITLNDIPSARNKFINAIPQAS
jgi:hypothetical protein